MCLQAAQLLSPSSVGTGKWTRQESEVPYRKASTLAGSKQVHGMLWKIGNLWNVYFPARVFFGEFGNWFEINLRQSSA